MAKRNMDEFKGLRAYVEHRKDSGTSRVKLYRGSRYVRSEPCASQAEAHALADAINRIEGGVTVEQALKDYAEYMRAKGNRESSIATTLHRLKPLTNLDQVANATRLRVGRILDGLDGSVDTRKNTLNQWRTFFRWCVGQGHLKADPTRDPRDPLKDLKVLGTRNTGKPDLTIDEARKLEATCITEARNGDATAVATLFMLHQGMRVGEIAHLRRRGVDDGGRVLDVKRASRRVKSKAGERLLLVSPVIRELMEPLLKGLGPDDLVFGSRSTASLRHHCRRLCRLAGVPEVTPHGLRDTHSKLAAQYGTTGPAVASMLGGSAAASTPGSSQPSLDTSMSVDDIARSLGHESTEVTVRHYIGQETMAAVTQDRALSRLRGSNDPTASVPGTEDPTAGDLVAGPKAPSVDKRHRRRRRRNDSAARRRGKNCYRAFPRTKDAAKGKSAASKKCQRNNDL